MRKCDSYNSHTLLMGVQNDAATLGNMLAVSYKVIQTLIIRPSHPISDIYLNEMKIYGHMKPVHVCLQQLYS